MKAIRTLLWWASLSLADRVSEEPIVRISGWLRPSNLSMGSGGNRIVHCLNTETDGIDLVCGGRRCLVCQRASSGPARPD